jgi:hypothetical protein
LGLPNLAAKVEEAMNWFGKPYPREREQREAALGAVNEDPFSNIEDEVVDLIYEENAGLEQAALKYIGAHGS